MIRTGLLIATLLVVGCGSKTSKSEDTGPRVTGGAPVDNSVRPERPSVGGSVGEKK
ncbi:MAG: hypothetical protein K1X57_20550 [Gemmataceae bacterium]|nr:hypothetical protein [Gemmataceae bacterium]